MLFDYPQKDPLTRRVHARAARLAYFKICVQPGAINLQRKCIGTHGGQVVVHRQASALRSSYDGSFDRIGQDDSQHERSFDKS